MPRAPHRPAALHWQVFRGQTAVRQGLLTPHQLRSSAWRRLRQDVYADARIEPDHELACRAAALRLPDAVSLAGPSAAYLHGVPHAAGYGDDVHVVRPYPLTVRPQRGLRIHAGDLAADDVEHAAGLRRTTAARTAWDVANWLDTGSAVAIIDALVGGGRLTVTDLDGYLRDRRWSRGAHRAGAVFALVDGHAQSPPESRLRVRFVLDGLPRPVAQHPVRLASGLVLHPDLAWPQYRVAVEYDGLWHADPDRLHHDRRRLNHLVTAGWIVLHVTSRRLHRDFAGLSREVRAALRSRGWQG